MSSKASVLITLGQYKDLKITNDERLVVYDAISHLEIDLGRATSKRITELQGYLEELRCFTPDVNIKQEAI